MRKRRKADCFSRAEEVVVGGKPGRKEEGKKKNEKKKMKKEVVMEKRCNDYTSKKLEKYFGR